MVNAIKKFYFNWWIYINSKYLVFISLDQILYFYDREILTSLLIWSICFVFIIFHAIFAKVFEHNNTRNLKW